MKNTLKMMFGQSESLCCNETLQFEDYDKELQVTSIRNAVNDTGLVFPQDRRRAFELPWCKAGGIQAHYEQEATNPRGHTGKTPVEEVHELWKQSRQS